MSRLPTAQFWLPGERILCLVAGAAVTRPCKGNEYLCLRLSVAAGQRDMDDARGHPHAPSACLKRANKRLMHRSKQPLYSINSSGRVSSVGGTVRPSKLVINLPHSQETAGRRPENTTTSGTQWNNSSVSKASLQKTGVFLDSAGDFWEFSAQKFEHRSPETISDEKSRRLAGLSHPKKEIL